MCHPYRCIDESCHPYRVRDSQRDVAVGRRTILEMMKRREKSKKELLQLTIEVVDKR